MQPSRNAVKTYAKSTFLRFQHYSTFEFLIRKTWLKLSEIDEQMDAKIDRENVMEFDEKTMRKRRPRTQKGARHHRSVLGRAGGKGGSMIQYFDPCIT